MDDHRNRTIRVMLQHAFDEYWKFVHGNILLYLM